MRGISRSLGRSSGRGVATADRGFDLPIPRVSEERLQGAGHTRTLTPSAASRHGAAPEINLPIARHATARNSGEAARFLICWMGEN